LTQVIARIDRAKYRSEVVAGNHQLIGDKPIPFGQDLVLPENPLIKLQNILAKTILD
jgi:hypothetical protein